MIFEILIGLVCLIAYALLARMVAAVYSDVVEDKRRKAYYAKNDEGRKQWDATHENGFSVSDQEFLGYAIIWPLTLVKLLLIMVGKFGKLGKPLRAALVNLIREW